ncbi:rhamnulose-1-phosphate aldolase/alcohol dehydrogenase [Virgibacillus natechei]|uniref:Rhamnulose-1-phosphate aldolase/alcohol dehydrogenase n=1 Tax=Virgibacillus natechei TaxID=1216297 RepID=A0ABS4IE83_9BACI|nr:bifunctional aldolase/short-chain dehydrogenase [Virgibacillus natechei]MBP1969238.1 rhamnulose-1-phosphate aldolase/alcohol dehydrogenase [Virgibacillus natechei]UZD12399.1 bifunctional aldolase/short-chain dehydrogenase [Virgibacillus natechei]
MVKNRWDNNSTFKNGLNELVYRSNLLGQDRSVANWGGGNTSTKSTETDFRGNEVEVMWVKGSGSDLATMKEKNFTGLRMEDIRPLMEREDMTDEEMVDYLAHCMIDAKHPRSSIETLLHAFLPYKHVDHTHPDAIISIACATNGPEIAKEIYGDRYVWVPYVRPGFKLSKMIAEGVKANPNAELVIMEKHGLVTWGETSKESYDNTISVIQEAEDYLENKAEGKELFGGSKYDSLTSDERKTILASVLPVIRGEVSEDKKMIVTNDDSENILSFVNSKDAKELSQVGAACPDHLVHTKRAPLFVEWDPASQDVNQLIERVQAGIAAFKETYISYFNRNKSEGDKMVEAVPRVLLIPGIGMINTGKSWSAANVSESLYHRAVSVMRGSTILGDFVSLNEAESFAIEYWPLELYKLSLAPPEAEFSRHVAFVTGGAGGIGSATCKRLLSEGAHVVVADINLEGAQQQAAEMNEQYGENRALAVKMDVTKEEEVIAAIQSSALTYGGLDIIVNNAGLASSSPFEETTLDKWNLNMNVLVTGYFLVAREAFKLMKDQEIGGSMVFVGSKNSIYAGKNAAAYSTAKAAEVHLARTIAADGGEHGIRVNSVLPDAVIRGSKIWDSQWKKERASSYGIGEGDLEEHYRKRTILNVNILPEDIADSIAFLSSSKAAKTTGCMVTVDGGVAAAFTR